MLQQLRCAATWHEAAEAVTWCQYCTALILVAFDARAGTLLALAVAALTSSPPTPLMDTEEDAGSRRRCSWRTTGRGVVHRSSFRWGPANYWTNRQGKSSRSSEATWVYRSVAGWDMVVPQRGGATIGAGEGGHTPPPFSNVSVSNFLQYWPPPTF